jgi:SAM-dependent methyltransferase
MPGGNAESPNRAFRPYEVLSDYYDAGWGSYSLRYPRVLRYVEASYNARISSVLDISCGTGRLVEALREEYTVAGSDISEAMLRVARARNPGIDLRQGNMTSIEFGRRFDAVLCTYDSINYLLEDEEMTRALTNIRRHLVDDGHLFFDFNTPRLYREYHNDSIDRRINGKLIRQILEYDPQLRYGYTVFDFGDQQERHVQRAYEYGEMAGFLGTAGLKVVTCFDGGTFKEVRVNPGHLAKIVVAARCAETPSRAVR